MNKYILIIISLFSFTFNCAQEDTTFFQAHDYVDLDWYGNYDAWGVFPDGEESYRKILMHYDMRCSSSGCSGWDYTTKIIILKPNGEYDADGNPIFVNAQTLANVITPYGTYMQAGNSQGSGFSPNWVQRYTYDVTDFAHLLVDSVKMRAFYGGWSTGFNVTLNFEFIEGTPPREVVDIHNLWSGSDSYSNLNDVLADTLMFISEEVENAAMRVTISGHGQDGEFTEGVNYRIKLDNNTLYTQEIWRDDCGEVALYPQGGTWIYDRANWCPGDKATTREHELTNFITPGEENWLDFDIYKNNWNPAEASYIYDAQLITYKSPNFNLDAAMEDIITPSMKQEYFRFNPSCSNPIVKIKNQGSDILTSATIEYGFDNCVVNTYNWNGSLSFGESEIIDLPLIDWCSFEENIPFYARIALPNGSEDNHSVNNILYSEYDLVSVYPEVFAIWFKTNNQPSETSYELRDANDNLIFSKTEMSANTLYKDTVVLSPGCYKFQILDTGGNPNWNEDGLSWWANTNFDPPFEIYEETEDGYARLKSVPGGFFKYYQSDFGTELTDYFRVEEWNAGLLDQLGDAVVEIYPNPTNTYLNIDLEFPVASNIEILITDFSGKKIKTINKENFLEGILLLNLNDLARGMYNCSIITNQTIYNKSFVLVE